MIKLDVANGNLNIYFDWFRLSEKDLVCVREGYSLQKQIPKHKEQKGLEIK